LPGKKWGERVSIFRILFCRGREKTGLFNFKFLWRNGPVKIFWKALMVSVVGMMIVVWGSFAHAAGSGVDVSADEALKRLMDGNTRYTEGTMTACRQTIKETRKTLSKGQKPYAVILSCSDSRVPPEIIFDKTFGEIFVVRVAGNVPDPVVLGSIEYAVQHIGTPLIMVLGHERCGAAIASIEAHGKPQGNIGALIKAIAPAVKKARQQATVRSEEELIEKTVDYNIQLAADYIIRQSLIIRHLVKAGKVRIVTAKYDLDEGTVTLY
jgi:carbonic anhydrase